MSNILVTGSKGQLGSDIQELSKEYSDKFFFTDRDELDITDESKLREFVNKNSIEIIINCAAYTAVDKAESETEIADKANHQAVKRLAEVSKDKDIKLIHVSTDYVFDGSSSKPYLESDITSPNSVYGETKLKGEKALIEINPKNSIIIRTSWVYSSYGANFVKTMLRLGKEREEIGVVFDQVGTPTYAADLAKAILEIAVKLDNEEVEIYNYSNEGVLSWYDFAKEIMRSAGLNCNVKPIESKEYPTPANRPYYSLLNKSKIKEKFNMSIPYWRDSLDICLKKMGEIR